MTSASDLVTLYADIDSAVRRVSPYAPATPLLRLPVLDQLIRGEVLLKAECLQATGSFKVRGALNAMSVLTERDGNDSVVAFSSGNHGIGVAYAARCLEKTAIIVVPNDAPRIKVERIKALGGEIVFYDREHENREQIATSLLQDSASTLIRPFDDWHTIAGQGTCGAEILTQCPEDLDSAVICTGGGGLAAGVGTYLKAHHPALAIYTAEPEHWADHQHSFAAGQKLTLTTTSPTLCDGLMAPEPGELTFSINLLNGASGLSVSDSWVIEAMRLVWQHLGLRLEPSGAVGLACILASPQRFEGHRVVVTLSGGNVDDPLFQRLMGSAGEAA